MFSPLFRNRGRRRKKPEKAPKIVKLFSNYITEPIFILFSECVLNSIYLNIGRQKKPFLYTYYVVVK